MQQVSIQLENGVYEGPRPPVSIVILTINEEGNIADCIRSCAWCDDVHVLDSGSSDRTREIAESMGAKVHVNAFKSFGDQRNWAIDHIPCKHGWHFHLDADERFTVESVREMAEVLGDDGNKSPHVCYLAPSKMIFLGKWIKRSGGYPSYQVRLFKYGKCRFMDFGHGQREDPHGTTGTLAHPYLHYSFSKGLFEWLNKHNGYSDREALEGLHLSLMARPPVSSLVKGDKVTRRRAFKNLSYHLKFRPIWRFIYNYFGRMGMLDGSAGLHYCLMISMYEYWIELKIKERRERWTIETNDLVQTMDVQSEARTTSAGRPTMGGGASAAAVIAPGTGSGPAPSAAALDGGGAS